MTSVNEPRGATGKAEASPSPSWLKPWQQRWLALLLTHGGRRYENRLADEKKRLLGHLKGHILEIGPGPATNLRYYDPSITWTGVEPNPHLRRHAEQSLGKLHIAGSVVDAEAEDIPVPDESQDAVVCTLVLCSVRDVAAVLREVQRVIKAGGQFAFLEHVAAPLGSWNRRLQNAMTPISRCLGDGCHMNREPQVLISQARFSQVKWNPIPIRLPIPLPHIAGIAWK